MTPIPEVVDHLEPIEWVDIDDDSSSIHPPSTRPEDQDILVFTIHDGAQIPRHLWGERTEEILERPDIRHAYVHERDWGANLVAENLARALGLSGYLRVNLARFVLDFGRFPGTSALGEGYLTRHSMFPPVEHLLSEEAIYDVLDRYYDGISEVITQHFAAKRVSLGVHTYDALNATGTERPKISLVTRSLEYQIGSTIPPYVFDPLFPPILGEAVADRSLSYQVLLDLERSGHHTALNFPYLMPEGSVEIRAQVWFFFRHLRRHFCRSFPDTRERPEYQRTWQMLLDVTRRSTDCEQLRAYLHRYRAAPQGQESLFRRCRQAYARIQEFLGTHRHTLVDEYRYSPDRPSNVGIEVRKDLLSWIDAHRGTVEPRSEAQEFAHEIAGIFAGSVLEYVELTNRRADQSSDPPRLVGRGLRPAEAGQLDHLAD